MSFELHVNYCCGQLRIKNSVFIPLNGLEKIRGKNRNRKRRKECDRKWENNGESRQQNMPIG